MSIPHSRYPTPATGLKSALSRFHSSEQGDEGVNKILIIALICVPLVIVILIFGNTIRGWFKSSSDDITKSPRITK